MPPIHNVADVGLSPPVHAILISRLIPTLQLTRDLWKHKSDANLPFRHLRLENPADRPDGAGYTSRTFHKGSSSLATTMFHCDACHTNLSCPRFLVHQCPAPYNARWYRMDPVQCPSQCPAWNSSGDIKSKRDIHQAVIDIVYILGLDPRVVTAEDMTTRNSILQCLDSRASRQGRMTMIWSRAVWAYIYGIFAKIVTDFFFCSVKDWP